MSESAKSVFILLLFSCWLCLSSCGDDKERLLPGSWQATLVTAGADTLGVDPAEIGFEFDPDRRYRYRSTLRYREAGTWRYDNGYLFARDTTEPGRPERVVAIDKLTADSLILRMRRGTAETEQLMVFLRTSPPPE